VIVHRNKKNRIIELENYKKKWGMKDYRIFIRMHRNIHIIHKNIHIIHKNIIDKGKSVKIDEYHFFNPIINKHVFEITSIKTFLNRAKAVFKSINTIIVHDSSDMYQVFCSFDEVKQHMLIRKLAGV